MEQQSRDRDNDKESLRDSSHHSGTNAINSSGHVRLRSGSNNSNSGKNVSSHHNSSSHNNSPRHSGPGNRSPTLHGSGPAVSTLSIGPNGSGIGNGISSTLSVPSHSSTTAAEEQQSPSSASSVKSWVLYLLPGENVIVPVLAFVGGYVDAVGWLELQGVFTSSITGNLVVAAGSMTSVHGVLCRFLVTLFFTVGAALNTAISLKMKLQKHSDNNINALLYFLEAAVLLISMWVGIRLSQNLAEAEDPDHWSVIIVASIMAASMGLHNGAVKETIPSGPSTTVMTMTLVSIANLISKTIGFYLAQRNAYAQLSDDEAREDEEDQPQELDKLRNEAKKLNDKFLDSIDKLASATRNLLSFVAGAVLGAVIAFHGAHFLSLIVPIVLVVGLSLTYLIRPFVTPPIVSPKAKSTNNSASPKKSGHLEPSAAPLMSRPGEEAAAAELQMVALSGGAPDDKNSAVF
jgi:uncharacterized membrane protein YoaK (UPF0700 family)